jgi:hypothetical protein
VATIIEHDLSPVTLSCDDGYLGAQEADVFNCAHWTRLSSVDVLEAPVPETLVFDSAAGVVPLAEAVDHLEIIRFKRSESFGVKATVRIVPVGDQFADALLILCGGLNLTGSARKLCCHCSPENNGY